MEVKVRRFRERFGRLQGTELIAATVRAFPGKTTVVTSFGAESAVLLDLVAEVDKALPILFLDTGYHFPQTLAYRDELTSHLGLADVRSIRPLADVRMQDDADEPLWERDPDRCCTLRKVRPLRHALDGFEAWITGRKRYQSTVRATLPKVEWEEGRLKINPLAAWTQDDVERAFQQRRLPHHPLARTGYASIGCAPCTRPPPLPADGRSGRWPGREKTECGIHKARWVATGDQD